MITVLFWNLRKKSKAEKPEAFEQRQKNLIKAILTIAGKHQADILLFAEFVLNPVDLKMGLDGLQRGEYHFIPNVIQPDVSNKGAKNTAEVRKIQIFSRLSQDKLQEVDMKDLTGRYTFPDGSVSVAKYDLERIIVDQASVSKILFSADRFEHPRLTLRRLPLGQNNELLLAVVHLVSKRDNGPVSQREEARRIAQRIRFAEKYIVKHSRTIIVGDFNMDLTDEGMMLPDTFHSVRQNQLTSQNEARELGAVWYPFSVNMMWSLWSDSRKFPGGTYVYITNEHIRSRWRMLDQVLSRVDALPYWREKSLNILTKAGRLSLLDDKMKPDATQFSDHLPIMFQLNGDIED